MEAFVLINTELGREASVLESLKGVKGIKSVHALYGIYDIIVEVEADTMEQVKDIVFSSIRGLQDVRSTITLITYGESFKKD